MHFPVYWQLGPVAVSGHAVFETLAYTLGFWWYRRNRRAAGDFLTDSNRYTVIAAAIVGAALGSKLLGWLEDPAVTFHSFQAAYLISGRTIVGGLLGGTLAVEWAEWTGIQRRTGDLFAIPLCLAIAVGRIGCFLGGLPDQTYGLPTSLPWGVDFGDGLRRHPAQIYEVLFALLLAAAILRLRSVPHREGDLFRAFLVSYLAFRLAVDFLKPGVAFAGLTAIQWACLIGILAYRRDILHLLRPHGEQLL